jgi:hypothetical protein
MAALAAVVASPLSIDLTVHFRATADQGGRVTVRGTVTCSIDTTVSIDGQVVLRLNRSGMAAGEFSTEVACGATPTAWTADVVSDTDRPFRPGFAAVAVRGIGFDPENGIFAGVESTGVVHLTRSAR